MWVFTSKVWPFKTPLEKVADFLGDKIEKLDNLLVKKECPIIKEIEEIENEYCKNCGDIASFRVPNSDNWFCSTECDEEYMNDLQDLIDRQSMPEADKIEERGIAQFEDDRQSNFDRE